MIDYAGTAFGGEVLVNLTQGAIFQDPFFGADNDAAPTETAIAIQPSLAFDTFLTQGGPTRETSIGYPYLAGSALYLTSIVEGASNLMVQFDTERISHTYFPSFNQMIPDQSDFQLARITLSDDAMGTFGVWVLFADPGGEESLHIFDIVNGRIVPEPAVALAAWTAGALFLPRRRGRRLRRSSQDTRHADQRRIASGCEDNS